MAGYFRADRRRLAARAGRDRSPTTRRGLVPLVVPITLVAAPRPRHAGAVPAGPGLPAAASEGADAAQPCLTSWTRDPRVRVRTRGSARSRRPLRRLLDAARAARRGQSRPRHRHRRRQRAGEAGGRLPRSASRSSNAPTCATTSSWSDGLADIADGLRAPPRRVRAAPVIRTTGSSRFCDGGAAALVVGDENPLRQIEGWRRTHRRRAFACRSGRWTPTWSCRPRCCSRSSTPPARSGRAIHAHLRRVLAVPRATRGARRLADAARRAHAAAVAELLDGLPIDRSVAPVAGFRGGTREARRRLRGLHRAERLAGYDAGAQPSRARRDERALALSALRAHRPARGGAGGSRRGRRPLPRRRVPRAADRATRAGGELRDLQSRTTTPRRLRAVGPGDARRRTAAIAGPYVYTEPISSRPPRRTTRCGTPRSARWSRPAGCTATCACTGRRRFSSGRATPDEAFDLAVRAERPVPARWPRPERLHQHRLGDRRQARSPVADRAVSGTIRSMSFASTSRKFDRGRLHRTVEWGRSEDRLEARPATPIHRAETAG